LLEGGLLLIPGNNSESTSRQRENNGNRRPDQCPPRDAPYLLCLAPLRLGLALLRFLSLGERLTPLSLGVSNVL
jgi:hypothetical protein